MRHFFLVILLTFTTGGSLFSDSPRMILIEEFSNTFSDSAAKSNALFNPFVERNSDFIVPLVYHAEMPSSKDPFYQKYPEITTIRGGYYQKLFDFPSIPYCFVNGNAWSGSPYNVRNIERGIDSLRGRISPVDFDFRVEMDDSVYSFEINVKSSKSFGEVKLFVFAVEYKYSLYDLPLNSAPNGEKEFFHIPRKALAGEHGTDITLSAGFDKTFRYSMQLDPTFLDANVYLTAFVQKPATGEVLQAGSNFRKMPIDIEVDKPEHNKIKRKETDTVSVKFRNRSGYDFSCMISAYPDCLDSWRTKLDTNFVYLSAGDSAEISLEISALGNASYTEIEIGINPTVYYMERYYGVRGAVSKKLKYMTEETDMLILAPPGIARDRIKSLFDGFDFLHDRLAAISFDDYFEAYSDIDFDFLYLAVPGGSEKLWTEDRRISELAAKAVDSDKNMIMTVSAGISSRETGIEDPDIKKEIDNLYKQTFKIDIDAGLTGSEKDESDPRNIKTVSHAVNGRRNIPFEQDFEFMEINTCPNTYYDILEAVKFHGKKSEPLLIYCEDKLDTAGYYAGFRKSGDKGKIFGFGFGFETVVDTATARENLTVLLQEMGYIAPPPKITLSTRELIFFAPVDSSETKSFFIKNTGTTDVTVDSLRLASGESSVFDFEPKAKNIFIPHGDSIEAYVTFIPYSDRAFTDVLTVEADVKDKYYMDVYLHGYGELVGILDKPEEDFKLFPNPAKEKITINLNPNMPFTARTFIIDSKGETVYKSEIMRFSKAAREYPVNIEELPAGKYYLLIKTDTSATGKTFVIVR